MTNWADKISTALKGKLTGSLSHRKMIPPNRELDIPSNSKDIKNSSILLLLFANNNELSICLIKRPKHMKHHAGQIAFPGGRIEKDETALHTALRETEEEIGIQKEEITILGSLSPLYVGVSNFVIHPFVGWLDKKPEFNICKDEVDKTIVFPLLKYRDTVEEIELNTTTGNLVVPCIPYKEEVIWGATAMILSEFYDVLN